MDVQVAYLDAPSEIFQYEDEIPLTFFQVNIPIGVVALLSPSTVWHQHHA
jgi:hypothetical protein